MTCADNTCCYCLTYFTFFWGTGVRGLTGGMATIPQGNQEPLVVRDRIRRPQVSLGWASPWNVIFFHSVLWPCWLGDRKGIQPVRSWVLVCWWWRFDWSFERWTSYSCSWYHHPLQSSLDLIQEAQLMLTTRSTLTRPCRISDGLTAHTTLTKAVKYSNI